MKDAEVGLGEEVMALVERHVRHTRHQPARGVCVTRPTSLHHVVSHLDFTGAL